MPHADYARWIRHNWRRSWPSGRIDLAFRERNRKPSFDNLRRLARALDVSTDFLLGTVDEVGLGAAGQTLYRHVENLSDEDRSLAEGIMKLLADKNRPSGGA